MKEEILHETIDVLINYIIDNPPAMIMEGSMIPLHVFGSSQLNDKERRRCYMDILEIAISKATKQLGEKLFGEDDK